MATEYHNLPEWGSLRKLRRKILNKHICPYRLSSCPKWDFALAEGSGRKGSRLRTRLLPTLSSHSLVVSPLSVTKPGKVKQFTRAEMNNPLSFHPSSQNMMASLLTASSPKHPLWVDVWVGYLYLLRVYLTHRDSICDGTAVWEHGRQVALAQSDMETSLLMLLTVVPRRAVKGWPREPLSRCSIRI